MSQGNRCPHRVNGEEDALRKQIREVYKIELRDDDVPKVPQCQSCDTASNLQSHKPKDSENRVVVISLIGREASAGKTWSFKDLPVNKIEKCSKEDSQAKNGVDTRVEASAMDLLTAVEKEKRPQGEKHLYVCHRCNNYSSTNRCHLVEHVKAVHQRIRDLKCHLCPSSRVASYSYAWQLDRHYARLHSTQANPSLACNECSFVAASRKEKNVHRKETHRIAAPSKTGTAKAVKCKVCTESFVEESDLTKHLLDVHVCE